jgi:hypothetical protein
MAQILSVGHAARAWPRCSGFVGPTPFRRDARLAAPVVICWQHAEPAGCKTAPASGGAILRRFDQPDLSHLDNDEGDRSP